jgi:hypothetical protein
MASKRTGEAPLQKTLWFLPGDQQSNVRAANAEHRDERQAKVPSAPGPEYPSVLQVRAGAAIVITKGELLATWRDITQQIGAGEAFMFCAMSSWAAGRDCNKVVGGQ